MNDSFHKALDSTPNFESPKEELHFLDQQVEQQTEAHLGSGSFEQKKEKVAEQVVEAYKEKKSHEVLHESMLIPEEEAHGIELRLAPEEHDDVINQLFNLMLERGVKNALDIVARMKNPHLEDDFHRFLVQYLAQRYEIPGLKPKSDLAKSLGLRMFEILLPIKTDDKDEFRSIVSRMEQFMAGLQSIAHDYKNVDRYYYTLELTLANESDEMALYVTVPEFRADLLEKQLLGIFENVRITEVFDDYNIFSYQGMSIGSVATPSKYEILQTKVYDEFDYDPMRVLVNAFTKLSKDGEGAAVQIVVVPNGDTHIKEYGEILDELKKGESLKDALGDYSIGQDLVRGFGDLLKNHHQEEEKQDQRLDEDAIESVSNKLKSTIVQTNVRILASAPTRARAEAILHELESSFSQFDNTRGNGFSFTRISGAALEDLIHDFIFRVFDPGRVFRMNLKELATIYHFPLDLSSNTQIKQVTAKVAPAPSSLPQSGVSLGINKYRHLEKLIKMSPEDRLRHFYVIGQTGTGKTHLLKSMIIQDIKNGDGVCFIDPHGSDVEDILNHIPPERVKDVIYFDPAHTERSMALNMLEYDTSHPEQKSFVINELLSIFNKLFDMKVSGGPMFEQYFRNAAGLVMEHPESGNTLLEIGRVLASKPFRDMKLRYCANPIIKQFWENAEKTTGEQGLENYVPYITSKFDVFISNEIMRPVIAQQKSSFHFRDIMDNRKILLVNLSKGRLGEINANLIGLILVGKILMAALSRVDSLGEKLPPFYLYIDEFQNVTTDSISQILSEARKYGLGLHIAHQFIAQLDESIKNAVFGNVGSMATFRVSFEDAQYLEKRFLPTFNAEDIMRIENRNAYLQMLAHGKPLTPFSIETLPLGTPNPAGVSEKIKQLSFLKYGKPRAEVDADILRRYQ